MKRVIILFILLTVVLVSGCVQSPANVAKEVPGVLKNVSDDISAMETPNITFESVLQPLKTSIDYVQPARIVPTPKPTDLSVDPIVGDWLYAQDNGYRCSAQFTPDAKASASCSSWGITLIQKSFIWNPSKSPFNWMRNYTLNDVSDNTDYAVLYSERTGRLTSDILPSNGYFVKVG
jgi:hypothetical protein